MNVHTPGDNFGHDQPCTELTHAGKTYAQCEHTPGPWTVNLSDETPGWYKVTHDVCMPGCTGREGNRCQRDMSQGPRGKSPFCTARVVGKNVRTK